MIDLDMTKRMKVISDKHGWKDNDVLKDDELAARIEIIRQEDRPLWEQMRANALAHAMAEGQDDLDS